MLQEWDHKLMISDEAGISGTVAESGLRYLAETVLVPFNPTAENMAKYLHKAISIGLACSNAIRVRVHETETGWAEYTNR